MNAEPQSCFADAAEKEPTLEEHCTTFAKCLNDREIFTSEMWEPSRKLCWGNEKCRFSKCTRRWGVFKRLQCLQSPPFKLFASHSFWSFPSAKLGTNTNRRRAARPWLFCSVYPAVSSKPGKSSSVTKVKLLTDLLLPNTKNSCL